MKPKARPGTPKGAPKPAKRSLDIGFAGRLKAAMSRAAHTSIPALALKAGCTRAVLGKYLTPGKSKTIEALLLFDLADALDVSAEWLLTGKGEMGRARSLSSDQLRALNIFDLFQNQESRDLWLSNGEKLLSVQLALFSSNSNPFPSAPMASRSDHAKS